MERTSPFGSVGRRGLIPPPASDVSQRTLLWGHMDEAKHGRRPHGLEARRRPWPRAGMTQWAHSRALSTRTPRCVLCATRVAKRSLRRPRRHPPLAYSPRTSAQRRVAAPPSLGGDSDVPGREAVPPPAPWAHHIRSSRSRGSHMTEQSQLSDAEPHDAEITDLTQHRRRADSGARLSAASAASVRDAAIAVLSRGVRYLPVVEDGTLVGLVALEGAPDPATSMLPAAHAAATPSTVIGRRAR